MSTDPVSCQFLSAGDLNARNTRAPVCVGVTGSRGAEAGSLTHSAVTAGASGEEMGEVRIYWHHHNRPRVTLAQTLVYTQKRINMSMTQSGNDNN